MSLKAKLATTIAALCMVICLLTVGVWAAKQGTVSMHGTVSFVAEDVSVKIYGALSGTDGNDNIGTPDTAKIVDGDKRIAEWNALTTDAALTATWGTEEASLDLGFANKGSTIKLVIKVENTNEERSVKYTFAPQLKGVTLTSEAKDIKYTESETEKSTNVTAKYEVTGTTAADATTGTIAPLATANFIITLTITNQNNSVPAVNLTGSMTLENVK